MLEDYIARARSEGSEGGGALKRVLFVIPPDATLPEDDENYGNIPRAEFTILRHGRRETFTPSPEDYARAGLRWTADEEATGVMSPQDMLRFLCAWFGDAFFASEDTLRDLLAESQTEVEWDADTHPIFCGRTYEFGAAPFLPHELDLFLQAHDWTHPKWDFENDAPTRGMAPQVQAMRPLAEAIVSGDLSVWHRQDVSTFTSHWKHWADRTVENQERQAHEAAAMLAQVLEMGVAYVDTALQVLSPPEREEFEADARQRLAAEETAPIKVRDNAFWLMRWQFGAHVIEASPEVVREWLRRRANRSEDSP